MAHTYVAGTAGRVRIGSNVIIDGITAWTIDKVCAVMPIPHFETTADSDGVMWPAILTGLAGATGTIEGYYDCDATNKTEAGVGLSVGLGVTLDLILYKTTPFGYSGITVTITGFSTGANVENQPVKFRATFTVNGDPAKGGTVS